MDSRQILERAKQFIYRNARLALIRQQQDDGGWPINWMTVGPGAETEWRGHVTVERLKTLRAYGVLSV